MNSSIIKRISTTLAVISKNKLDSYSDLISFLEETVSKYEKPDEIIMELLSWLLKLQKSGSPYNDVIYQDDITSILRNEGYVAHVIEGRIWVLCYKGALLLCGNNTNPKVALVQLWRIDFEMYKVLKSLTHLANVFDFNYEIADEVRILMAQDRTVDIFSNNKDYWDNPHRNIPKTRQAGRRESTWNVYQSNIMILIQDDGKGFAVHNQNSEKWTQDTHIDMTPLI
jgi:hypothetical protein